MCLSRGDAKKFPVGSAKTAPPGTVLNVTDPCWIQPSRPQGGVLRAAVAVTVQWSPHRFINLGRIKGDLRLFAFPPSVGQ